MAMVERNMRCVVTKVVVLESAHVADTTAITVVNVAAFTSRASAGTGSIVNATAGGALLNTFNYACTRNNCHTTICCF